jgi:hypothetical protein
VDDLVDGLTRAMESPHTRGEVLNLGNPEEHTVMEIAELVRRLTDSDSTFVFTDPAVGDDPRVRCPDIGKARALLSWEPSTSLEVGLRRVIGEMLATYNGQLVPHHGNGNGTGNGYGNGTRNGNGNGAAGPTAGANLAAPGVPGASPAMGARLDASS